MNKKLTKSTIIGNEQRYPTVQSVTLTDNTTKHKHTL